MLFVLGPTYGITGERLLQIKLGKGSFNPQILRLGELSALFKRTSFSSRKPVLGFQDTRLSVSQLPMTVASGD